MKNSLPGMYILNQMTKNQHKAYEELASLREAYSKREEEKNLLLNEVIELFRKADWESVCFVLGKVISLEAAMKLIEVDIEDKEDSLK